MFSWNVWGEPLMSSPWAKRVWLAVKNKIRPFQVQSFCQNLFSGWYAPFSGASHMIDSAPITRNWIGSGKDLMPQVSSVWRNTFLLLRLLLYSGVRTAFRGCRLPTSSKTKHTGTGYGSSKRSRCSMVWLDQVSSRYKWAFIIFHCTCSCFIFFLHTEFQNSARLYYSFEM